MVRRFKDVCIDHIGPLNINLRRKGPHCVAIIDTINSTHGKNLKIETKKSEHRFLCQVFAQISLSQY